MFLLFWLILLTSGARKQSRNRPAFRLPLSRAFKARPEPNGSNVFSISYGVENDEECLRNCLRHCLRHCLRTISETVLERGYIGTPKLTQFSRPDISGKQNSRSFPVPIYREGKTRAVFPSRYIGKAKLAQFSRPDISGKQKSRSFPVPIYRESKSRAVFPSRYIGKAKVAQFSRPDISGNQNSRNFLSLVTGQFSFVISIQGKHPDRTTFGYLRILSGKQPVQCVLIAAGIAAPTRQHRDVLLTI